MTKYQLLVLDIDGTTANSKKEIAEETREALIWLQGDRRKGFSLWQNI